MLFLLLYTVFHVLALFKRKNKQIKQEQASFTVPSKLESQGNSFQAAISFCLIGLQHDQQMNAYPGA